MSQELPGAGFGEPHEMFDLEIVVEFGFFVGGQRGRLLALNEIPDARTRRFGRLEVHHLARTQRGDKLNEFFVGSHAGSLPLRGWPDKHGNFAAIDSTLNIARPTNFLPNVSDAFPILTYGSHTGAFPSARSASLRAPAPFPFDKLRA